MASEDYKKRARKRAEEIKSKGRFKLVEGENTLRILRTPAGDNEDTSPSVYVDFKMHQNIGPDNRYMRCGLTPAGKGSCVICDKVISQLKKKGNSKRATLLVPREVMAVQVAKVSKDGEFTGPFVWEPSPGLSGKIISQVLTSKRKDYVDHKKGFNITIERTGTGKNDTRYGMIEGDEESTEVPKSIVKKLKPFDQVLQQYDEKKLYSAYRGTDSKNKNSEDSEDMATSSSEEDTKKKSSSADSSADSSSEEASSSADSSEASSEESSEEGSSSEESSEEESSEASSEESSEEVKGKGKGKAKGKGKKKDKSEEEKSEEDASEEESEESEEKSEEEVKGKGKGKGKKAPPKGKKDKK